MTNPGLPPPLSSAHRERVATRVIDLRKDIEEALADLDSALAEEEAEAAGGGPDRTNGGQSGSVGGRDNLEAAGSGCVTKVGH